MTGKIAYTTNHLADESNGRQRHRLFHSAGNDTIDRMGVGHDTQSFFLDRRWSEADGISSDPRQFATANRNRTAPPFSFQQPQNNRGEPCRT